MIKRNPTKQVQNNKRRWRTYSLILTCGLLVVSGFFLAGRQHFSSMDYGMKNSRLRKQINDLEGEKRRLLLAREISLSPTEIKKAAKKAGFNDPSDVQPMIAQVATVTKDKAAPPTAAAGAAKPMVVNTVSITPAKASIANFTKKEAVAKQIKRTTAAE